MIAGAAILFLTGCFTLSVETGPVATWDFPPDANAARPEALVSGTVGLGVGAIAAGVGFRARPSAHGTEYAIVPQVCGHLGLDGHIALREGGVVMVGGCVGFTAPSFGTRDGTPSRGAFGPTLMPAMQWQLGQTYAGDVAFFPLLRVSTPMGYDVRSDGRGDSAWIGATVGLELWFGKDL